MAPKKAAPKPAKAKKEKPPKVEKIRPTGLPEGYELAGKMPRYIGWLINFAWNFGITIGLLSILATGVDSSYNWLARCWFNDNYQLACSSNLDWQKYW